MTDKQAPFICTFESRRSEEMRSLIERFGGQAFVAPSMQELPIGSNTTALAAIREIIEGSVSQLILMTGVGTEAMLEVAATDGLKESLLEKMANIPLMIRGPKPAAVLKKLGLSYTLKAPEPNTWRELVAEIDSANVDVAGQRIGVQEYGIPNLELYAALEQRGASVIPLPVYRWALPDDISPLKTAIEKTIAGDFQALLFTSAQQVRHVLEVADASGQRESWLRAANLTTVASIGPTCSEALQAEGLVVSLEASPPKMGPLVRSVMEHLNSETQ